MTTANKRAPIYLEITWIARALEREYTLQGIIPGSPLSLPYAKLLAYCPQDVINAVNYAGHPDFIAVSACLELAQEHGLIIVERMGKGRRNTYRLPPSHPRVRETRRQNATGNALTLIPRV